MVESFKISPEKKEATESGKEKPVKEYKPSELNFRAEEMKDKDEAEDVLKQLDDIPDASGNARIMSVDSPDIGNLYGWNRGLPITKSEVMDVVNKLKEPYNTEISNFIKNQDILGLQKYLNNKIKEGKIDAVKLKQALTLKGITFNGSILEDGKFGPQTLETIKFILEEDSELVSNSENPKIPPKKSDPSKKKKGEPGTPKK